MELLLPWREYKGLLVRVRFGYKAYTAASSRNGARPQRRKKTKRPQKSVADLDAEMEVRRFCCLLFSYPS